MVAGHLTNIYEQMAALDEIHETRPNRYHAVRYFAGFFERYPELDNFQR